MSVGAGGARPGFRVFGTALGAAALTLLLGACASLPPARSASCAAARRPPITFSADGRTASTRISVLTYNIEGLPWPARSKRGRFLRQIARHLDQLHAQGRAPDILLFQEAFSSAAVRAIASLDYPSLAAGPDRGATAPRTAGGRLPGHHRIDKGELGIKILSGGLAVAADYPILRRHSEPYPQGSCAGFDCLANKGLLDVELAIPGVPGTLRILDTHMNSQHASGVSARRHHSAHREQASFLQRFAAEAVEAHQPVILGGDFNMRHSEIRFGSFQPAQSLEIVHRFCASKPEVCEVRMSWDDDEPWMDTQDLQLFRSGAKVTVQPVSVEAMFDGEPGEPRLSDHDGFLVTYELKWSRLLNDVAHCP